MRATREYTVAMPPRRLARRASAAALLVVVLALTGCGLAGALQSGLPTGPTPAESLPPGVSIDVYQSRIDYSEHKLEIAIANASAEDVEVLSAEFSTPAFHPAARYDRAPTTIAAGTTTDLRIQLPLADCQATSGTPSLALRFSVRGVEHSVTLSPRDRLGQLPRIVAEDCRGQFVEQIAPLRISPGFTTTRIDGKEAAVLELTATPTGRGGILTLDQVRGTPLLGVRDPATGVVGDTVPLGIDLGAATEVVRLPIVVLPARCDPHVVLEDKRGTFLNLTVTTRLDTGVVFVGVDDATRVALYDFVGRSCGWTEQSPPTP